MTTDQLEVTFPDNDIQYSSDSVSADDSYSKIDESDKIKPNTEQRSTMISTTAELDTELINNFSEENNHVSSLSHKKQRQQRFLQKQQQTHGRMNNFIGTSKKRSYKSMICDEKVLEGDGNTKTIQPLPEVTVAADELYFKWFHEHNKKSRITWVTSADIDKVLVDLSDYDRKNQSNNKFLSSMMQPYYNIQQQEQRSSSKKKNQVRSISDSSKNNEELCTENENQYFIAEGTETIRLLIQQLRNVSKSETEPNIIDPHFVPYQPIKLQSIFIKPSLLFDQPVHILNDIEKTYSPSSSIGNDGGEEEKANDSNVDNKYLFPTCPPFHIFVGTEDIISSIAGYTISRGILACGIKPDSSIYNENWIIPYIKQKHFSAADHKIRIVAIDGINDTSNLGSIIRCSSAFGIDMILLSSQCCNEWSRRSIRVSMGHISRVPCIRMSSPKSFENILNELSKEPYFIKSYAAVVDPGADILLEQYPKGKQKKKRTRQKRCFIFIPANSNDSKKPKLLYDIF